MRNLKRALSLALASVMLLGMMVVGTSASYTDVTSKNNQEAIEVLQKVGVMTGDEKGNFNPDANVTRNEMAVIMCNLLGLKAGGSHPFTDVPTWAAPYVAACYNNGIIAGVSADKFNGDANVTAVQASLMTMKALGYFGFAGEFGDNWKLATVKQASKINLYDGINIYTDQIMTRNEVAQLVLNALESDVMIVTEHGGLTVDGNGITVSVKPTYDYSTPATTDYDYDNSRDNVQQLCEKLYGNKLTKTTASQWTPYGLPAVTWNYPTSASTDKIGTYATTDALATWTTGIQDITLGDLYKALGNTGALDIFENGTDSGNDITPAKGISTKSLTAYKGATLYAVDTDDDGVAERICVAYPYLAQVTKVTEATAKADRKVTLKVWNDNAGNATTGVTYETEDFAKDDYVLVFPGDNMTTTEAWNAASLSADIIEVKAADVVKGKVSSVSGANGSAVTGLTVGGTKYTLGGDLMATRGLNDGALVKAGSFGFKNDYTLLLSNGYVLGADGDSVAANIDNIVYVTKAAYSTTNNYGETAYYVETVALDGTIEIVKNFGNIANDAAGTPAAIAAGYYTKDYDSTSKTYKFVPVQATPGDINNTVIYYAALELGAPANVKTDTASLSVGGTRAYLTDTTRVIYAKDSGSDLKVSVTTGAFRQDLPATAKVLLSKDGSYEVEAIVLNSNKVSVDDKVSYLDRTVRGSNDNGNEYRLYDLETGKYTTVTGIASNVTSHNGYVTYTVDDKGVYTFAAVSAATSDNGDGTYAIEDAGKITRHNSIINVDVTTGGTPKDIVDLNAAKATIINLTAAPNDNDLSLSDLTVSGITLVGTVYVEDEAVVAIVITNYVPAP